MRNVARQSGGSEAWRCEAFVFDSVAQGITEFAHREGVDLIAMYTHDRKGLGRLMKGSVAREVHRIASTEVRVFTPLELAALASNEAAAEPMTPPEEILGDTVGVLRRADVLKGLTDQQLGQLEPLVHEVQVKTGQSLGGAGELGEHIYIIVKGEAQLGARTDVGDIAARVAGPGDSFPLAVLVGSGNLITSAQAMTDMEVLRLGRSDLDRLCNQNPEIGMRVYKNVADLFVDRYGDTLRHLARSVEREIQQTG